MTPEAGAALRAALLERLLAEGLSVDAALDRARLTMAWVERGDGPLALPKPAPAFAKATARKPGRKASTTETLRRGEGDAAAPEAAGGRRAWNAADDAELKRAWGRESLPALAARLGRKYSTVYGRARELGLPPLGPSRHQRGGGRRAAADAVAPAGGPVASDGAIVAFLRGRDYAVAPRAEGGYSVDGRMVTRAELIAIANRQCRKLGRPEFTVAA